MAEPYEPSWRDKANCLGTDVHLWFPTRGESTREAKTICAGCVVRDECLEEALELGEHFGIRGGMSERERRRIRKARRDTGQAAQAETPGDAA